MKVLADTSVWIEHFRRSAPGFQDLLLAGNVFTHSAVVGELACGNLMRRAKVLGELRNLPAVLEASREDTLLVIESRKLWGRGIGWTDAQLIASALLTGCVLWTLDKALGKVAAGLKIDY